MITLYLLPLKMMDVTDSLYSFSVCFMDTLWIQTQQLGDKGQNNLNRWRSMANEDSNSIQSFLPRPCQMTGIDSKLLLHLGMHLLLTVGDNTWAHDNSALCSLQLSEPAKVGSESLDSFILGLKCTCTFLYAHFRFKMYCLLKLNVCICIICGFLHTAFSPQLSPVWLLQIIWKSTHGSTWESTVPLKPCTRFMLRFPQDDNGLLPGFNCYLNEHSFTYYFL